MYRMCAWVCPARATRVGSSHFGEYVLTECRKEKSAMISRFGVWIKLLFYPLCAFKMDVGK